MGAGRGFERGAQSIRNSVTDGLRMGLQQKRNEQLDELYKKRIDYRLEFKRGMDGLGPSYQDELDRLEEEAAQVAATRPEIPSSVPTSTPGPLGIPQTTFPVGKQVQPMPAAAPTAPGGGRWDCFLQACASRAWGPCQGCAGGNSSRRRPNSSRC